VTGYVANGIPLTVVGDEADWVVAMGHFEPQDMARAAEEFTAYTFGEASRVPAGTVQLRWGVWNDGALEWEGIQEDTPGAFRVTLVGVRNAN
jgi:hypothetical protein